MSSVQTSINPIHRSRSRRKVRTVLASVCEGLAAAILAWVVISRVFYSDFGYDVTFDVGRLFLIVIAIALILLRRAGVLLDPRTTLSSLVALTVTAAGLAVLPMLNVNVAGRIRSLLTPIKARVVAVMYRTHSPREIYRLDDRYGYVHIPKSIDWERARGYSATYTINADGHRVMPIPAAADRTVVFLGDSFTFGLGVGDQETYPYVLAKEHWQNLRVVNAAVDGWGLTQAHLALTDMLATPPYPDAVILAIIPDDLRRSHLRPPSTAGQQRRLEWIDRQFVSRDLPSSVAFVDDTPTLLEQEAQLAYATLAAMTKAARLKGTTFAVILLDDGGRFPPGLIFALGRDGVPTLDLTRLGQTSLPYDFHPDRSGHRAIAAAIAESPLTHIAYGRALDSW